jgi:membrane protease YdiL (CAAX protease family)
VVYTKLLADHQTTLSTSLFILAAHQIGLHLILGLILRKKTTYSGVGISAGAILLFPLTGTAEGIAGKAIVFFLTYALFVGFGEEVLYRGQSRLNEVFGKPYRFFGVAFGWGTILTALFFGFTHVGIISCVLGLSTNITLAWGFWTFFGGLVFGFIRERVKVF